MHYKFYLCFLSVLYTLQLIGCGSVNRYYVSPSGHDDNPGTQDQPFQTLQKAIDIMQAGDQCFLKEGRYQEAVQIKSSNASGTFHIQAYEDEQVILDGTESIEGKWQVYQDKIYKISVDEKFDQLFVNDKMLVQARWPNMSFPDQLWDRSAWASAKKGSKKGHMFDPELAETGIDWTGALAVLNISHQWWSWTCPVIQHHEGQDFFKYDTTGQSGIYDDRPYYRFDDDFYYLTGKLEALDTPGEWYLDDETLTLYLWMPDNLDPNRQNIRYKKRLYAIQGADLENLRISGLDFFGCTIKLDSVSNCLIEDCHFNFPTFTRLISERWSDSQRTPATFISGSRNTITKCSLGYANGTGLIVLGSENIIDNNLVHDVCWNGSLDYNAIRVRPLKDEKKAHNLIRHNTVFNSGNALITVHGPKNIVEYNHVHHGGRACQDVSLIYCYSPNNRGTEYRYNWVHDCYTPHIALGLRGDDFVLDLRVHHNVAWNCGWFGILVKGDSNLVCNNTAFNNGRMDILVRTDPSQKRPQYIEYYLESQNQHSRVHNNAANTITGEPFKMKPLGHIASHNYQGENLMLMDPNQYDFRPKESSPLIDAGIEIPGYTDGYKGKAPDLGAYEYGGERWIAGVTWGEEKID